MRTGTRKRCSTNGDIQMDENDLTLLLTILWILSSKSNQEKALALFNLIKSLS